MSERFEDLIEEILSNPESYDEYIQDVRSRRARMREWKERECWLIEIYKDLENELQLAVDDGDDEIAEELRMVIEAFKVKFDQHQDSKPFSFSKLPVNHNVMVEPTLDVIDEMIEEIQEASVEAVEELQPLKEDDTGIENLIDKLEPELTEEESARLIEKAHEIYLLWESVKGSLVLNDNMEVDRSAFLETKAIRCTLNGLQESILPAEAETILARSSYEMSEALNQVMLQEKAFPFTDISLEPDTWEEFALRYRKLAKAFDAMDWYVNHYKILPQNTKADILNSIASTQKLLFRKLDKHGLSDPIQGDLFHLIQKYNDSAGFLSALQETITDKNLLSKENDLDLNLEKGRKQYEDTIEMNLRKAKKEAAIDGVIKWAEKREGRTVTESSEESDRVKICELLDACIEAKVPPSDSKVREAILDVAPILLEGLPAYAKFLDSVKKERVRRGLDETVEKAPECQTEEPTDEELEQMRLRVLPHVTGKKLLMIGGNARDHVANDIERLLECKCEWKGSEKGDKSSKYQTAISHVDILLILKNLVSHEICEKGREWIEAKKGHCVKLPAGYGLKQIVYRLDEHFTPRHS